MTNIIPLVQEWMDHEEVNIILIYFNSFIKPCKNRNLFLWSSGETNIVV